MLVAKSNHIRKLIVESNEPDLTRINLSNIPGGPEIFEKAAKFCYGVNFEITVHNVAALRCAAEYLQMTEKYRAGNLASRTEDFLTQVSLTSLSGAIVVLKSCEDLLPMAEDLKIVQRCIDVASTKVPESRICALFDLIRCDVNYSARIINFVINQIDLVLMRSNINYIVYTLLYL